MSFESGRSWQKAVFHFICILPPWLQLVVLCFSIKIKELAVFPLPWMCVSLKSRLLFRIMLLFLIGPCIPLAFFTPLSCYCPHHKEAPNWYTGCFVPAPMVIFLSILWGLLVCFWAIVISSKEHLGSRSTIDVAQYPFPFSLPGTWGDRKLTSKPSLLIQTI